MHKLRELVICLQVLIVKDPQILQVWHTTREIVTCKTFLFDFINLFKVLVELVLGVGLCSFGIVFRLCKLGHFYKILLILPFFETWPLFASIVYDQRLALGQIFLIEMLHSNIYLFLGINRTHNEAKFALSGPLCKACKCSIFRHFHDISH